MEEKDGQAVPNFHKHVVGTSLEICLYDLHSSSLVSKCFYDACQGGEGGCCLLELNFANFLKCMLELSESCKSWKASNSINFCTNKA